ncbi:MAG: type II toxin-antitoxin system VapC family toxin [Candidatus Bathyarchaeia archaeon]|nr:type II toxin-antitoxin system VapC family toxin [Candidatus Bathyarchaeota archaeon]
MSILDTDVIIEMLREKRHVEGAISIITLIEFLRGLEKEKRARAKRLLEESFKILNLDNEVIEIYCTLYQRLREMGSPIPDADLLIAATAISHRKALKTRDEDFERLKPLGLELA